MARSTLALALVVALVVAVGAPSVAKSGEDKRYKVVKPDAKSPEHTVQQAFIASQNADEKLGFDAYLALVHPDRRSSAITKVQIRRYSWTRFRNQAKDYILRGTEGGYIVARRDPAEITSETHHVRLFVDPIHNARRVHAAPIRLKRHKGQWYIQSNSL